ncbi:MAG TPA: SMP-30/gluconolactonase/LRE family protein [Lysobacter sp.]|nr:SMP-30/gluconolactonase/LRE family protein [Lysobacter sp.]
MRRRIPLAVLTTLWLSACVAHAQTPPASPSPSPAVAGLEQAYERTRSAPVLLLLAQAYADAGQLEQAANAVERLVAQRRGLLPPPHSPLWPAAERNDRLARALATLERAAPRTRNGRTARRLPREGVIPEAIEYHAATAELLLGDAHGRRVIAVDHHGKRRTLVDKLAGTPFGIRLGPDDVLWIAQQANGTEPSALVRVELGTGARVAYTHAQAKALNDIAIAPNGDVYVTDFGAGALFRLDRNAGRLDPVVAPGGLRSPNGVCVAADGKAVYVAQGVTPVAVDPASGAATPLTHPPELDLLGIDGLYCRAGELLAIQNVTFAGRVLRLKLDGPHTVSAFEVLDANHPEFDLPTTGTFRGDTFLVLANSQIYLLPGETAPRKPPSKRIVILSYPLPR